MKTVRYSPPLMATSSAGAPGWLPYVSRVSPQAWPQRPQLKLTSSPVLMALNHNWLIDTGGHPERMKSGRVRAVCAFDVLLLCVRVSFLVSHLLLRSKPFRDVVPSLLTNSRRLLSWGGNKHTKRQMKQYKRVQKLRKKRAPQKCSGQVKGQGEVGASYLQCYLCQQSSGSGWSFQQYRRHRCGCHSPRRDGSPQNPASSCHRVEGKGPVIQQQGDKQQIQRTISVVFHWWIGVFHRIVKTDTLG